MPPAEYKGYLRKSPTHQTIETSSGDLSIPHIAIKTGLTTPDGREELLTEYLCDQPGCPNVATHVLGCAIEVGAVAAVCDEHAPKPRS